MSVLVVGVSHRSAPVSVLEKLALSAAAASKLALDVLDVPHVNESSVVATCNRVEIYTDVDRFHGSVEALSRALADQAGVSAEELIEYLYVHYDEAAVGHLFQVSSGLDSMVVGESQILGQCRTALQEGQDAGTVGPALNLLFQQALRVGKRAQAETAIAKAAPSVVSAAFEQAVKELGQLAGKRILIVGAGAIASLAAATGSAHQAELVIVNRTDENAARLAEQYQAHWVPNQDLWTELSKADLVVSGTGASGLIFDFVAVQAARREVSHPLVFLDLALPHDVAPEVTSLPGVKLVSLATLANELAGSPAAAAVADVKEIVASELADFLASRRAATVTPTLVALRGMASEVVGQEVARIQAKLPQLDAAEQAEVASSLRRVAEKLLHQPTVRVKELANDVGAVSYAAALAELFALSPEAVDAVSKVEEV